MADLIAQGAKPNDRWRRALPVRQAVTLGRGTSGWGVPWDDRISRKHAELFWNGHSLEVSQVEAARNSIFVRGRQLREFHVAPGEHFVIGETTFTLANEAAHVSLEFPRPLEQQSFTAEYLQELPFRHADMRIEVLSRLPEVISGALGDTELFVRLVNLLLAGIPRAAAVAIVAGISESDGLQVEVLHWDRRLVSGEDFQPSQRLIEQAISRGESVLHMWGAEEKTRDKFTLTGGMDWAFCTPVRGKATDGLGIYVAGSFRGDAATSSSDPKDLRDDLKFAEVAAATFSSVRELRSLERERAGLSQFFSPLVLEAIAGEDPVHVLAPREVDVAVLFCDLRGFSRRSEAAASDLLGLLNRVSAALGVTTHYICEQGGVLGDFHGDAAMGFWGWPFALGDAAVRAARAALAITREFAAAANQPNAPLAGFEAGIGIASGRAVAGRIGTHDQVKVTAFGPVVNLASRLEGMTKLLHAPILVDQATATALRGQLTPEEGRLRRLALVRPYGALAAVEVSELLPPEKELPAITAADISHYERALDSFLAGQWSEAFEQLHHVTAEDRVKDFVTSLITQHHRKPPQGWDGVIALESK